jgi:primosomal protein N' (replication factor Y)
MFAIVAVNAPVQRGGTAYRPTFQGASPSPFPGPVFHYHVPRPLDAQVVPGTLVTVPFGPRQVQGLVIARADQSPVPETRPIAHILIDEPVLSAHQIELGMWLSEHYMSPLIDCLRLMLPPGMLRQPRTVVRLHPEVAVPPDLDTVQRQVVELLRQYDTLSPSQIGNRLGKDKARDAIRSLIRQGMLIKGSDLPRPRARPKRARFVRLCAAPPQVAALRSLLGRPSKQAQILQALLDQDDPLPPVSHVLSRAGATSSTLSLLEKKGWIEIEPERRLLLLTPKARHTDLGRAYKQQAIVEYLDETTPVAENTVLGATDASPSVLRTLDERELVQRIVEPATLILRLSESQAWHEIVELRGAAGQHRVLDYLLSRPFGEWLWISWVYAETECSLNDLRALEGHGLIELAEREIWRDPLAGQSVVLKDPPRLTPDQEQAWAAIRSRMTAAPEQAQDRDAHVFLLHGVTGSGKTEIYMRAAQAALDQGRQVIILVPEISMTPQTIRRFAARFPDQIGVMHSTLSDGERYDVWRRIRAGHIRLVIGPRSALFAPFDDIGLIVLDEEHSSSYKQSDRNGHPGQRNAGSGHILPCLRNRSLPPAGTLPARPGSSTPPARSTSTSPPIQRPLPPFGSKL